MQGSGNPDVFGGLPPEFSNEKHSKIAIIPVPFDLTTTYNHGSEKGPGALIEASRNMELYDIETDFEVYRKGIFTAPPFITDRSEILFNNLYEEVLHYIRQGKFVVTLGGEHSVSFAPIKAHVEFHGPISILQLDAHSDLIHAYEGNPYSHASVMARALELPAVEKLVAVGIRSMAAEERSKSASKTETFFAHDLFKDDKWMDEAIAHLTDTVYITFDLDVFDSSLMPATGTPEPGGLFWHHLLPFLRKVAEKKRIVGFDVVELCPIPNLPAPDFLAAKLVYKLLSYIFNPKGKSDGNQRIHEEALQTL